MDGKRAVSASDDKTLKVWDSESGRELRTLKGHSHSVYGVAVTPDGKQAVSASWDITLKVWELESGRALGKLQGHGTAVSGVAVTPNGKRAVSASYDKTLKVRVIARYDNSVNNKYNPNPNKVVYYGDMTWDEMHFPSWGVIVSDKSLTQHDVVRAVRDSQIIASR
jgi:WD40 repeat protein